jgi:hypothetical protein
MASGRDCTSCHAPIVWAKTTRMRRMPLDAMRDGMGKLIPLCPTDGSANVRPTGQTVTDRDGGRIAVVEVVAKGEGVWRPHFATCPKAKEHRRRR